MICTPHQILLGDYIENKEMGRKCRAYGGEESCIQGFVGKNLKEGDHMEDPGIDGRIILRWIFRIEELGWGGHGLIDLTQERDRRQALLNAVLNLQVA